MAKTGNVVLKFGGILKQFNKLIGEEKMMKILSCEVKVFLSERHLFLCDLFKGNFFIKTQTPLFICHSHTIMGYWLFFYCVRELLLLILILILRLFRIVLLKQF